MYELPQKLPNDLSLRILKNKDNSQNYLGAKPRVHSLQK